MSTFETVIDLLFIAGMVALGGMTLIGWLLISRKSQARQTRVVGANSWFLSASIWAKILFTFMAVPVWLYLFYLLWRPFVAVSPDVSPILRVVGLVLFLAGGMFVIWARWTLGKNWAISTSAGVQLQTEHRLIQSGPFALVRHPMYLGGWVTLGGITLAYHTWAALILLLSTAIFVYRARIEETALSETFGREWRTYTARVPRFIPHLRQRAIAE